MRIRKKAKQEVKTETKAAPAAASAKDGAKAEAAAPPARPQKIKLLKKEMNYRGARYEWWMRLKEFDGKTEGEFIANAKEKPPALTRNGTPENPTGWVRFFVREGVISLHV